MELCPCCFEAATDKLSTSTPDAALFFPTWHRPHGGDQDDDEDEGDQTEGEEKQDQDEIRMKDDGTIHIESRSVPQMSWRTWVGSDSAARNEEVHKTSKKKDSRDQRAAGQDDSAKFSTDAWAQMPDPWQTRDPWSVGKAFKNFISGRGLRADAPEFQPGTSSDEGTAPCPQCGNPHLIKHDTHCDVCGFEFTAKNDKAESFFIGSNDTDDEEDADGDLEPALYQDEHGTIDIGKLTMALTGNSLRTPGLKSLMHSPETGQALKGREDEFKDDDDEFFDCEEPEEIMSRLVETNTMSNFPNLRLLEHGHDRSRGVHRGLTPDAMASSSSTVPSSSRLNEYFGEGKLLDVDPMTNEIKFYPIWSEEEKMSKLDKLYEILEEHVHSKLILHANTRLPERHGRQREGLLVDCGAIGNLSGEQQIKRMAKLAKEATGIDTIYRKMSQQMKIEGVGAGAQQATMEAVIPICLPDGTTGHYIAPFIPDSEVPALLGLRALMENRALIDVTGKRMIWCGAGGFELKLSPGSKVFNLEVAPSGHLLLPATEWHRLSGAQRHQLGQLTADPSSRL